MTVGYFTDLEALYVEAGFPVGPVGVAVGFGSDGADAFYAGGESGLVNLSFGGEKILKFQKSMLYQCLDHLSTILMQKPHS